MPDSPPVANLPVADYFHGTRVIDNYRWLEKADSPEMQKWVAEENDLHSRAARSSAGRDCDSKAADGIALDRQRQRSGACRASLFLYPARGLAEPARAVCTRCSERSRSRSGRRESLAADGTVALDWFQPSENGKYVAYGTSPSGSEMSTLHVIESKTGTILPDTIERTRAASIAWLHDNSGFYYTRYPKKGEVPAGRRCTTAMFISICWAAR